MGSPGWWLCLPLPGIIFLKSLEEHSGYACAPYFPLGWKNFHTVMRSILGLGCCHLLVMIVCYSGNHKNPAPVSQREEKHKAVRLIFVIMIVYFLFWAPYSIVLPEHLPGILCTSTCKSSSQLDRPCRWQRPGDDSLLHQPHHLRLRGRSSGGISLCSSESTLPNTSANNARFSMGRQEIEWVQHTPIPLGNRKSQLLYEEQKFTCYFQMW